MKYKKKKRDLAGIYTNSMSQESYRKLLGFKSIERKSRQNIPHYLLRKRVYHICMAPTREQIVQPPRPLHATGREDVGATGSW